MSHCDLFRACCSISICTTFHRYPIFSTRYSVMCKVYTGYCGTSEIEHSLCACTVQRERTTTSRQTSPENCILCSGAPCPTDCPLRSVNGRCGSALWCHVTEEVKERPLTYKSSPRQDVSQTRSYIRARQNCSRQLWPTDRPK